MSSIPASHRDILEKRAFAHLATVDESGAPQVTPVWFDDADGFIWVNSAKGRKKDRNIRANPRVALSIQDPDNPYRYVGIQGEVVEITEEGAVDHINKLSHKYMGRDYPYLSGDEVRVIYKIKPTRVWVMG
ncbi:MAG: PPOX class F420-dependent oxidoreductase [Caldilineae bacterium]|nr:MAG: PPOX class F420-dependent oxidoreductase [Caldilineae bacterium]